MVGDRRANRINQSEDTLITSTFASSRSKAYERHSQTRGRGRGGGRRQKWERGKPPPTPVSGSDSANNQYYRASQASIQPNSTQPLAFGRILKTDPEATAALWARVRGAMAPTTRSRGKPGGPGRGKGRGGQSAGRQVVKKQKPSKKRKLNTFQDEDAEILSESSSIAITAYETVFTKATKITTQSPHFQSLVLEPRMIVEMDIDRLRSHPPYPHFETIPPPTGQSFDYKGTKGLDAADFWLSLSDDEVDGIVEEYKVLKAGLYCEQEYALFATETFLKRQSRYVVTPEDRKWRATRTVQLHAPPITTKHSKWVAPPSFDEHSPEYKFDIRPDCAYWLSLAGFNAEYLGHIHHAVYVDDNKSITCPYFTIEFKKHGRSLEQAQWQACAAASMALYNRYRLKSDALQIGAEQWSDSHKSEVKHYVMTFIGRSYCIWVLRPNYSEDSTWNGCFMEAICGSECTDRSGVRTLEAWINEIHRWGLSKFAPDCERDIKTILGDIGIEVSAIDFELSTSEEPKGVGT